MEVWRPETAPAKIHDPPPDDLTSIWRDEVMAVAASLPPHGMELIERHPLRNFAVAAESSHRNWSRCRGESRHCSDDQSDKC
jgi:hypothetical protein